MQGLALEYARTARPFTVLVRAFLACSLLYPFFRLASALVYAKVRTNIGIKKGIVSGGGSLTASLDDFFEAIGLQVVNGWGLTEVSIVMSTRSLRAVRTLSVQPRKACNLPSRRCQAHGAKEPDDAHQVWVSAGPCAVQRDNQPIETAITSAEAHMDMVNILNAMVTLMTGYAPCKDHHCSFWSCQQPA